MTAFRSPETAPAFADSIPRINVPGLPLRFQHSRSQARSAFCSTAECGWPRFRPSPRFCPLLAYFRARSTSPLASTPLRDCYLPPDQSSCQIRNRSVRLPVAPDLLSLPTSLFLSLVGGSGSPFQVRYVSGGLLFLKPLGTFITMRLELGGVKDFWTQKT